MDNRDHNDDDKRTKVQVLTAGVRSGPSGNRKKRNAGGGGSSKMNRAGGNSSSGSGGSSSSGSVGPQQQQQQLEQRQLDSDNAATERVTSGLDRIRPSIAHAMNMDNSSNNNDVGPDKSNSKNDVDDEKREEMTSLMSLEYEEHHSDDEPAASSNVGKSEQPPSSGGGKFGGAYRDVPADDESGPSKQKQQGGADGEKDDEGGAVISGDVPPHLHHHHHHDDIVLVTAESKQVELIWLFICFMGIMASFVCYGLLLEYATTGDRELHELSFLFVTSGLYTLTAAAGRYVRDETPSTIPPARFAVLGLTSMGSTFFSVRSLRYVIYPIQVLAKSCKPVPVMIMGALMGKKYPMRKYVNVVMIVLGVALFMGAGNKEKKGDGNEDALDYSNATNVTVEDAALGYRFLLEAMNNATEAVLGGGCNETASGDDGEDCDADTSSASQLFGICLLFISLCFDGGTGAYEDKLMSVHSVQPFDLMYNIQLGKTILAGIGLLVLNQLHIFIDMVREMGFLLVALGLSGALGQVFIFVTIAKFGALTCSIIGLARKVTTLVASIYFYGHSLNTLQFTGLVISVGAMVMNFWGKKKGGGGGHGHGGGGSSGAGAGSGGEGRDSAPVQASIAPAAPDELAKMLDEDEDDEEPGGDVEMAQTSSLVVGGVRR